MSGFDSDDIDDDDAAFDDDIEDGGSFAENNNVFENGVADAEEGPEGVFREDKSVFSTPRSAPEPHTNRLTTQAAEDYEYQVPKVPALQRAKESGVLVAKWMSTNPGDFRVAWSVDGKLVEAWRSPTRGEFEQFKNKGRWLKGGMKQPVAGTTADAAVDAQPASFWQRNKKKIFVAGGVLAAGGAAWYLWKKYWAEADGEVENTR